MAMSRNTLTLQSSTELWDFAALAFILFNSLRSDVLRALCQCRKDDCKLSALKSLGLSRSTQKELQHVGKQQLMLSWVESKKQEG